MSQDLQPLTTNAEAVTGDVIADLVWRARERLETWIERNGWAGFDPYDLRGMRWYMNLARWQALPLRAARKVPLTLINRYPLLTRKLACSATLSEAFPERFVKLISRTLPWIIKLMQNRNGSFAYLAFANGRVDRTPYLRWGQAWMLRALAELQFVVKQRPLISKASSGRGAA
jgi:hypothetical protein